MLVICNLPYVAITCDILPTGTVTMAMEVLHNTCNMSIYDFPDMYAESPQVLGIHIRQTAHAHITTIARHLYS